MILIFSNSFEPTTNAVIDWLLYFKKDVIRINPDDGDMSHLNLVSKKTSADGRLDVDFAFKYKDKEVRLKAVEGYWYRRGKLPSYRVGFNLASIFKPRFIKLFRNQLSLELNYLNEYLFYLLRKKTVRIGDPDLADVNKMIVLDMAAEVGLLVPDSYILSSKQLLGKLLNEPDEFITKPLVGLMVQGESERYFCYTEKVNSHETEEFPEELFPSLLQSNIPKVFEIRSFYLHGRFFSMAIFSQNDSQTQVDFRKYNNEVPNRTTPYQLPKDIENKLHKLMVNLKLDSGSFDIIATPDGRYIFLEVNPVGQFGMVSHPCNYYLEKVVAQYLSNVVN
jgi:ATP-GRASP peptide maturase of grasp-with-spasm system